MGIEHALERQPLIITIKERWVAARDRLGSAAFMDRYVAFAEHLKETYPDAAHYRAYHALIGSTLRPEETGIIETDFPGDDSVVKFLESLAQ